jgi:hypothetical protein
LSGSDSANRPLGAGDRARRIMARHSAWAFQLAARFGTRTTKPGFAKVQLTDYARPAPNRSPNKPAAPAAKYDQRRWIRNEFQNLLLQQVFVTNPLSARTPSPVRGKDVQQTRSRPLTVRGRFTPRLRVAAFATELAQPRMVVRTGQAKALDLPLEVTGMKIHRRTGAGRPQLLNEDDNPTKESPSTRLARRYRRVEHKRERIAREFASERKVESTQWMPAESPGPIAGMRASTPPRSQPPETFEAGAVPLRQMNVTQVADEVIKQLDRKLIAARERMGRI